MALINMESKCALCGKILGDRKSIIAFPSFTDNRLDPLYILSDSAAHRKCLHDFKHTIQVRILLNMIDAVRNEGYVCMICKARIINPDELVPLGYITTDKRNPLFEYNYMFFHNKCIHGNDEIGKLLCLLNEFVQSDRWDGIGLKGTINEIENYYLNIDDNQP